MSRSVKRLACGASIAVLAACSPGCAWLLFGAAAGAGTYAYVNGELKREFAGPLAATFDATLRALRQLELPVIQSSRDELVGKIRSERADGKAVHVTIEPLGEGSSRVRIRVGVFGDKDASRRIAGRIARNLGHRW